MDNNSLILPPGVTLPPMNGRQKRRDTRKGPKHTGRFAVLNAFIDGSMCKLTRSQALTWLVLYRDSRDGIARTSFKDIAGRVGCSPRSAVEAVKKLRELKLVHLTRRGGLNRGANVYRVTAAPD